ncbi:MAG: PEP-CTERM sorting domain-containing protein [Phycisphaerae bacterium]
MKKKLVTICAVAALIAVSGTAGASVLTFDGSAGYATFIDEYNAYRAFMGTPDDTITFDDIGPSAAPVGNYYLAGKGASFINEGTAILLADDGGAVGGWQQGSVNGYDGTYMPNNNVLYNKVSNANPLSELTVLFTNPVKQVGSFVSNSTASYTVPLSTVVKAYDSAGNLLATVTAVTRSWGHNDNIEGFWGINSDAANIARITFLALTPPPQYVDVTTLDNIEWIVPEPATIAVLSLGGLLLRRKK